MPGDPLGAGVGIVLVLAAFALPTPVGSNATRLSLLFALPVVASFVNWRSRVWNILILLAVLVLQLPVAISTVASTGRVSG